jgi:hypothetical protein
MGELKKQVDIITIHINKAKYPFYRDIRDFNINEDSFPIGCLD